MKDLFSAKALDQASGRLKSMQMDLSKRRLQDRRPRRLGVFAACTLLFGNLRHCLSLQH